MQVYRCTNCMGETEVYPCRHCGYQGGSDHELEYALMPGRILNGKYLVGRVLGQGGFGITYIGFDLTLERKVAIKEYFPTAAATRQGSTSSVLSWNGSQQLDRQAGLQAVMSEARKMARLESIPQVVSVGEAFEENNTAYIVMDFVEGESLKRRIRHSGPLPWPEVQQLFLPVIGAMEKVHQAGLIHRDISPDNLMYLKDGTLKLLDLGAAKDISSARGGPSAEVVKNGFSPFEQYTLRGSAGPWSDVYALAATMFYCLTGQVPPSAVDRVASDTMDWSLLKAVPRGVQQALQKAMAIQMKDRTQSMAAFAEDLQKKAPSRKRKWIPIAAAAAALAVILPTALLLRPKDAPPASVFSSNGESREDYRLAKVICHPVDGESYTSSEFTYDDTGKETNTYFNPDGSIDVIYEYTYFENGSRKTAVYTSYNEYGEIESVTNEIFKEDGTSRSEATGYEDGEISYTRLDLTDAHRHRIHSEYQDYKFGKPSDYSTSDDYRLEHDEHNNLIASRHGDATEGGEELYSYTFDSEGRILLEHRELRDWYGSGGSWEYITETHYQYDGDGNLIQWRYVRLSENAADYDYLEETDDYENYPDGRAKTRTESYDGVVKYVYEYIWEKAD